MFANLLSGAGAFTYENLPLRPSRQQIRLLGLTKSRVKDDPIFCYVGVYDIDRAPPYKALSYTWGSPEPVYQIYVNYRKFNVRQNLFHFFESYRLQDIEEPPDQYLWIDQVCIDQSNNFERSQQVRMMSQIYKSADSVIVWLGLGDKRSRFALDSRTLYEAVKDYNKSEHSDLDYLAVSTLLHDEYFDRLWVVQEFVLAKNACILVKDAWMPGISHNWLRELKIVNLGYGHPLMSATKSLGAAQMLNTKLHTRYHTDAPRYEPLEDLLVRYRDQDCNDPRDRIYALLGLADPKFNIPVDYERLPQQVFMDAILAIIRGYTSPSPNQLLRWTRSDDSQQLCALAERIGCTPPQLQSLRLMMKVLWQPFRRTAYQGRHFPFNAMGFEPADSVTGTGDAWWLDFYGTRYHIECSEKASQAEILRLLEEDYERIHLEDEDEDNWETEEEDEAEVARQAKLNSLLEFLKRL